MRELAAWSSPKTMIGSCYSEQAASLDEAPVDALIPPINSRGKQVR